MTLSKADVCMLVQEARRRRLSGCRKQVSCACTASVERCLQIIVRMLLGSDLAGIKIIFRFRKNPQNGDFIHVLLYIWPAFDQKVY